jgi:F0F1-type ATP synthase assembly protein I
VPAQSVGFSALLGMGAVIAAVLAAGLALGWLVDSLVGTSPVFLLVGLLLGIIGAVSYTVAQFRQYLQNPGKSSKNTQ